MFSNLCDGYKNSQSIVSIPVNCLPQGLAFLPHPPHQVSSSPFQAYLFQQGRDVKGEPKSLDGVTVAAQTAEQNRVEITLTDHVLAAESFGYTGGVKLPHNPLCLFLAPRTTSSIHGMFFHSALL